MRFRTAFRTCATCVSITLFAAVVYAADAKPSEAPIARDRLPAACHSAKAEFRAISRDDVAQAKTVLLEAIGRLDQRLTQAGQGGQEWRNYLRLSDLQQELRSDKQPNKAVLAKILARYSAGHEGLELVWFLDTQRALHNYIATANAVDSPAPIRAAYEKLLDKLAATLETYLAKPTTDGALTITESVRWLQSAHQAPGLVEAIERHLGQKNLHVEISAGIVATGIAEPVDDVSEVRDCILGTSIVGTAHTKGQTGVELVPNAEMGVLDTLFFGTATSDNVGYHKPVTIYSNSETSLAARKRLWITDEGLASHPAASNAETTISIHDIQSNKGRRFIEKMAWRRAGKQQSQAECIASSHAEQRLNERIDSQAAESLDQANKQYVEKYKQPFTERKLFPQTLRFSTTPQALSLVGLQAGGGKLAAPSLPPPVVEGADMSLRLHESAINNLSFDALAGRTVYEEKMQAAVTDALGKLPEKMKGDEDGKPWAITFAPRQPISVTFADDGFKVTLRGVNFAKGDEDHPVAMNISAAYKIEKSAKGFRVVRQGEIEVFPPDFKPDSGQQLDARRQVIRKLLERRFAKVFESEFLGEGLELPGKWKTAGKLTPIQVVCRDGWLVIAWKRTTEAK